MTSLALKSVIKEQYSTPLNVKTIQGITPEIMSMELVKIHAECDGFNKDIIVGLIPILPTRIEILFGLHAFDDQYKKETICVITRSQIYTTDTTTKTTVNAESLHTNAADLHEQSSNERPAIIQQSVIEHEISIHLQTNIAIRIKDDKSTYTTDNTDYSEFA